jgi:IclR family transcriptional regulator, pca regulon regulatory protein
MSRQHPDDIIERSEPTIDRRGRSEHVQSLERGLAVLAAFTARDTSLTISQVAERTSLSRATARRLLLTLEQLGYVEANRREFNLTPSVLELTKPFAASVDPWAFTKPYLQSLTDRLEESASIAVLDATEILYVARTPTRRLMTLAVTVGSRLPAHATSKGRVLLAFLPEAELEAYFQRSAMQRFTDRTVVNEDELREILGVIRDQGWAIVDEQLEKGLCSVAAPIVESNGRVSAALSVCAHAGRVDPTTLRSEFLPLVLETARRVSALRSRR